MQKPIKEVFKDTKIPSGLEGILVCALKIDNEKRSMKSIFLMPSLIPFKLFEQFYNEIKSYYSLNELVIQTNFEQNLTNDFLDEYKFYVMSRIFAKMPMAGYILRDSDWQTDGENIKVTVRHEGLNLCDNIKTMAEKIVSGDLGKSVVFSFEEEFMEIKFDSPPMPAPVKKPVEVKTESKELAPGTPIIGKAINGEVTPLDTLSDESGRCVIEGTVFSTDKREMKNGKILFLFDITDQTDSITCKVFLTADTFNEKVKTNISEGNRVKVLGDVSFDTFQRELTVMVRSVESLPPLPKKQDNAERKRVELHAHTKMSAMDGVAETKNLVARAAQYGHPAIAITDHGCVHAFPDAHRAKKGTDIKIIYGTEAYFVNDCDSLIYKGSQHPILGETVIFDIETTGLSNATERITEIGAVKICNGEEVARFETFVDPERHIPEKITEITGITDDMVKGAPKSTEAVKSFLDFCGTAPIIAHNAEFDVGFIRAECQRSNIPFEPAYLDTLALCRTLFPEKKKHKLDIMAEMLGIPNPAHHRAVNDAEVLCGIWTKCVEIMKKNGIEDFAQIDSKISGEGRYKELPSYHAVILVKNLTGLRNLYDMISDSNLKYFYKTPRILKSEYLKKREGLLISSACEAGELMRAIIRGADEKTLEKICKFYDYFEIQPLGNNEFMLENGMAESRTQLEDFNRRVVELGEKHQKPVVATCDVHFIDPEDEVYRRIIMASKGFRDADNQAPLYFRTTEEMLKEFAYLGKETAEKVVIDNTNLIADMIEEIRPVPEGKFPPEIEGSAEDIERMSREKAYALYGKPLPALVEERLKKELDSIIRNGFAVMYMIAHKLVKKSNDDGYQVGSRGSVGSSLIAFLSDITEVNALPAHYLCKNCKHSEFFTENLGSGQDLEDKNCPECGTLMYKDGHNIPFETFLGFNGEKDPDIDLNFSGEYQANAHKYTEELFGTGQVFRAGTISGVADKLAYDFARKYFEERGLTARAAELRRIAAGCSGVRRTTGQHPGGIIVVPRGHKIEEFTPVQHPADKSGIDIITTHFDYHSIDENLLKLDILGHDNPTVLKMLADLTGVATKDVPLAPPEVMSLFKNTEALGVSAEDIHSKVGTYALPEFGTKFVRDMLLDSKPQNMSDLIRVSGLSHGTNVWLGNAQDLIRDGKCTISTCICTRDDIMLYLIDKGVEPLLSFTIMESVRKGKGLKPEWEEAMRESSVPEWYIQSCKKISYMFPKAHAAAYVTEMLRIAWYKVHYPIEFYMSYFSVRADEFDYEIMAKGRSMVERKMKEIDSQGSQASQKDKNVHSILEVCNEMYCRGIEFCPIDIYESDATRFLKKDGKILPPLNSVPGLGTNAAYSIVSARADGEFISKDELYSRTGATKTVIEVLERNGCLDGMPDTSQVTFF